MSVPEWLLSVLACPERPDLGLALVEGEALAPLNARIRAGGVADRGGRAVSEALAQALVRADGRVAYPVRDGIPHLIVDEGLDLAALGIVLPPSP